MKHTRGFTLIELLVAMTVLAVVLGFVMSSFSGMLARQRLQAAAENVFDYLTLARTEAISRSTALHVSIASGANWCVGLDATSACTCSTANDCQLDGSEKKISYDNFSGISVSSVTSALQQFSYDPRRGMPLNSAGTSSASGDVLLSNAAGDSITIKLNSVGRVKLCTTSGFRGYSACP